jgi:myo-inositol-1(or 4)-monophosphatase
MKKTDLLADLELMKLAAQAAGDVAAAYFRAGNTTSAKVSFKAGDSPVSEADMAANTALERQLRFTRPGYGWVSEETADDGSRKSSERVFIVDPIDGTRAFIAGKADWCVSVGLVSNGRCMASLIGRLPSREPSATGCPFARRANCGSTMRASPAPNP